MSIKNKDKERYRLKMEYISKVPEQRRLKEKALQMPIQPEPWYVRRRVVPVEEEPKLTKEDKVTLIKKWFERNEGLPFLIHLKPGQLMNGTCPGFPSGIQTIYTGRKPSHAKSTFGIPYTEHTVYIVDTQQTITILEMRFWTDEA